MSLFASEKLESAAKDLKPFTRCCHDSHRIIEHGENANVRYRQLINKPEKDQLSIIVRCGLQRRVSNRVPQSAQLFLLMRSHRDLVRVENSSEKLLIVVEWL